MQLCAYKSKDGIMSDLKAFAAKKIFAGVAVIGNIARRLKKFG